MIYPPHSVLRISREPVQITGRYYGLVRFVEPVESTHDLFEVVHFNPASKRFDGAEETVKMPLVPANRNNTHPSTAKDIEKSPVNAAGWYIYGAPDRSGRFVVQALAPRSLLRAEPECAITENKSVRKYYKKQAWRHLASKKGETSSVLLNPTLRKQKALWAEGKRALLIHVYGGIGGNKAEPAAKGPLYFGHFAYGVADVCYEPLADELRFEIVYHQIYTHNTTGIIAGSLHWSKFMGDRTFGWLGLRPVADTLIELDEFTGKYEGGEEEWRSPLDLFLYQLEIMAARYRIGDGTGGTFVGPAYNCTQDANQALYRTLRQIASSIPPDSALEQLTQRQSQRIQRLEQLTEDLKHLLLPWRTARTDWKNSAEVLGTPLEENPVKKSCSRLN